MSKNTVDKSQSYDRYVDLYRTHHAQHDDKGGRGYIGRSILKQLEPVRDLCARVGATMLLDYGCGRGEQYSWRDIASGGKMIPSLQSYFGVQSIALFDPAVPTHANRPSGTFDVVICTDVLEHVPETEVPWVLRDIMQFARRGVFLSIASYKAGAVLPNGENAHVTIRPKAWWQDQIEAARQGHSSCEVHAVIKHKVRLHRKFKLKWTRDIRLAASR